MQVEVLISLFSEFLGLLVAFEEELLPAFTVVFDHLGIEVSRVDGTAVVSPGRHVCIGDGKSQWLIMFFLPHFKFIGERGSGSGLKLLYLLSVEGGVIKDLPLLRRALEHVHLLVLNPVVADHVLNHVFKLNSDLSEDGIRVESHGSTFPELPVLLIVILVQI